MTELIHNIFSTLFGDNVKLATILISMIPIIELRGAIPFATNSGFWGDYSLTNWEAFGWSLLGSCLIVPILAITALPIINWLKRTKLFKKIALALENRIKEKSKSIDGAEEKFEKFSKSYWKKSLGIFAFVAIPLPLTGVWTGTVAALFLGLDFYTTCISVILGNVVAGLLISLMLLFFPWLNNWLFYIFILIVATVLIYELIRFVLTKKKSQSSKKEQTTNNQNNNQD